MKQGKSLQELVTEIERQDTAKEDYIIRESSTRMADDGRINISFNGNARTLMPTDRFEQQLGTALDIPRKYYSKMKDQHPQLLAENVNAWLERGQSSHMVRALDDQARALLSPNYRRIDNYEIAGAILPRISSSAGMDIVSCEVTHESLYIKVVNERIKGEVRLGDIVQAGYYVSNSEVGNGSLTVQPLIYRLVCTNGMIAAYKDFRGFSRRHIGSRIEDAWAVFTDNTRKLSNAAILAQVGDIIDTLNDPARFAVLVETMQRATQRPLTGSVTDVVDKVQQDYALSKEEHGFVLQNLIRDDDLTLYGLANAITRASQDVGSYARATELEGLGFSALTMSAERWEALNSAAA